MGTISKVVHISVDFILVSAVLAGVRRSTGLTVKTKDFESKDYRTWVQRYLDVGEWVFDSSVAFMNTSPYFERKR